MISGVAAIAGIGATEFSKDSGRSELRLAAEAATAALADAGLAPADVDGLVTFTMDSTAEIALARELGLGELRFFSQVGYGGGAACAIVQQAAMAVATGIAQVVVCYRALNERSGRRFGQVSRAALQATSAGVDNSWHYPMGLSTPAATVAMAARRYMHAYGVTSADFGTVAVADRIERRDDVGCELARFVEHRLDHVLAEIAEQPLAQRRAEARAVLERKRHVGNRRGVGHGGGAPG